MYYPSTSYAHLTRRILLSFLLVAFFVGSSLDAQQNRRKRTRTTTTSASSGNVTNITQCPNEGIGGDPNLNRRKNIRSDNKKPTLRTLQWMKNLADPTGFTRQNTSRTQLARLGEGQKVSVVAYALVARKGGKESCNCKLSAPKDTDNHIVLVDPALKRPTLAAKRHNNWEIHPVLKMEYCPEGQTCSGNSNTNWRSLESR